MTDNKLTDEDEMIAAESVKRQCFEARHHDHHGTLLLTASSCIGSLLAQLRAPVTQRATKTTQSMRDAWREEIGALKPNTSIVEGEQKLRFVTIAARTLLDLIDDAEVATSAPVAQRADSDAIAQWLNTPEGKAAVANAVTLANEAAERLADARRIDPAMLNTPFAATSAPAEKWKRAVAWQNNMGAVTILAEYAKGWTDAGFTVTPLYASPQSPPAEPAAVAAAQDVVDAYIDRFDTGAGRPGEPRLFGPIDNEIMALRAILAALPMPGVSPAQEKGK